MNQKVLAIGMSLFLTSATAFATPGDTACKGTQNGKAIELLLGYDVHGQSAPSFIEVSENGSVVFTSTSVEETMVNVGTQDEPFINNAWVASDEESTATVRIPEQDPENNGKFTVVLTVSTDSGLFKANDVELTCER